MERKTVLLSLWTYKKKDIWTIGNKNPALKYRGVIFFPFLPFTLYFYSLFPSPCISSWYQKDNSNVSYISYKGHLVVISLLLLPHLTSWSEKSDHVGLNYKFAMNTRSPASWADREERSGMMPALQSEAQAEQVGALWPWGWRLGSYSCSGASMRSCQSLCPGPG